MGVYPSTSFSPCWCLCFLIALCSLNFSCKAFTQSSPTTRQGFAARQQHHFDRTDSTRINALFGDGGQKDTSSIHQQQQPANEVTLTDEGRIELAQRVLRADLGVADPSLLDDDSFYCISSIVDEPLSKTDYIAAGRFFNLRGAFPDLEYRAYDFRVDEKGTVRCTCRVTGTMRGELRLRDEVLPPTGKVMKCPPEGVSMDFDPTTGKVTKLCSGFCLDRFVGNTNGLLGVQAASIIAGRDVSAWENLPVTTVLYSIVARPAKNVAESATFVAPFPSTVMIQLAKGVLFTKMGYDDPTLLSEDYEYITPFQGPIRKEAFLKSYAAEELAGYYPNFRNFRVDPYEPTRVWVDLQPTADDFVGHPQCMSLSFDDDGYCTRITSSAVLDPSIGNAGGLGGPEGLKYARGEASAGVTARPLSKVFGRLRKRAFEPLTGVGVDEYQSPGGSIETPKKKKMTPEPPSIKPKVPLESIKLAVAANEPVKKTQKARPERGTKRVVSTKEPVMNAKVVQPKKVVTPPRNPKPLPARQAKPKLFTSPTKRVAAVKKAKAELPKKDRTPTVNLASLPSMKGKSTVSKSLESPKEDNEVVKRLEQLKQLSDSIRVIPEQISRSFSLRRRSPTDQKPPEPTRTDAKRVISDRLATIKRKGGDKVNGSTSLNASNKKRPNPKEMQDKKLELARKIQAERRGNISQGERDRLMAKAKQRREAARGAQGREEIHLEGLAKFASSASNSLFRKNELNGLPAASSKIKPPQQPKKKVAPRGVPTLRRWRKNSDKSVSGLVIGSESFDDGARVTTSPIETGTIAPGELVRTGSGTRYFLE